MDPTEASSPSLTLAHLDQGFSLLMALPFHTGPLQAVHSVPKTASLVWTPPGLKAVRGFPLRSHKAACPYLAWLPPAWTTLLRALPQPLSWDFLSLPVTPAILQVSM